MAQLLLHILTKMLCNKLAKHMKYVDVRIAICINWRQINDYFINAAKIISYNRKSIRKYPIFKLNFKKTFGNMDWTFLLSLPEQEDLA